MNSKSPRLFALSTLIVLGACTGENQSTPTYSPPTASELKEPYKDMRIFHIQYALATWNNYANETMDRATIYGAILSGNTSITKKKTSSDLDFSFLGGKRLNEIVDRNKNVGRVNPISCQWMPINHKSLVKGYTATQAKSNKYGYYCQLEIISRCNKKISRNGYAVNDGTRWVYLPEKNKDDFTLKNPLGQTQPNWKKKTPCKM